MSRSRGKCAYHVACQSPLLRCRTFCIRDGSLLIFTLIRKKRPSTTTQRYRDMPYACSLPVSRRGRTVSAATGCCLCGRSLIGSEIRCTYRAPQSGWRVVQQRTSFFIVKPVILPVCPAFPLLRWFRVSRFPFLSLQFLPGVRLRICIHKARPKACTRVGSASFAAFGAFRKFGQFSQINKRPLRYHRLLPGKGVRRFTSCCAVWSAMMRKRC